MGRRIRQHALQGRGAPTSTPLFLRGSRALRGSRGRKPPKQISLLVLALSCVFTGTLGDAAADEYQGDTVDGQRHGRGVLLWGDGHRYEGEFRRGLMHGEGVHTTPSGESYRGAFANGQRHGAGMLRLPSGAVYEGSFQQGAMTGAGRLTWPNGDTYEGDFVDGERTGTGAYVWRGGERYEGALAAGVPHGQGVYAYADGTTYDGRFENGRKSGRGALSWENGNRYDGHFAADLRHGLGHFRWRDGTLYKGRFAFGRQHGPGVKVAPGGGMVFQKWNDGELIAEQPVEEVPRCALRLEENPWMFRGRRCVNGLAHGDGDAVRADGGAYIVNGRFILGRLVRGAPVSLALATAQRGLGPLE